MSVDLGEFKPARCLDHGSDACDCSRLRAEAERLAAEVAAIKAQHERILSWPPQDVARADAFIVQAARSLARAGNQATAKSILNALDTTKRHRAQLAAEIDRLSADRAALLELAACAPDILASPRGWDRGATERYDVDDEDIHGLRVAWGALPAALRAEIEAGEEPGEVAG